MRQLFRDPRFVFGELIFIVLCGAVWLVSPQLGIWFILIALALFLTRLFIGQVRLNSFDWLILVFLITVGSGYWAAYDQATAWTKLWFIITGVLLFYSLRAQPRENLIGVSVLLFCVGIGVSLYFFLTYDFVSAPRRIEFVNKLGRWLMGIRPQTGWTPIIPNYTAGLAAITAPFILYPIWKMRNGGRNPAKWFNVFVAAGLGIVGLALFMATSRGVLLAIGSGVGAWLLWRLTQSDRIKSHFKSESGFPVLLLIYLCAIIAFLYAGPAQWGGVISNSNFYGTGSRAELFSRSLYLVLDYPITGGGLGAFPGLYSHYLLGIPFFYIPNSHNLFLDVTIEQGLFGGLSFLAIYATSVWTMAGSVSKKGGNRIFKWITLFSLIIAVVQGMVSTYLYNGAGSMLSLFLIGLSLNEYDNDMPFQKTLDFRTVVLILVIWVGITLVSLNTIRSIWYANLGAVQLAKVELAGFPNDGWAGSDIVANLDTADSTLQTALQVDPANRTANQRLGMIAMLRRDFGSAIRYLEAAHRLAPGHRGIIKSLGYSYAWSGNMIEARSLLSQIPEANEELDVYIWWWESQGRSDLSENAALILDALKTAAPSP